MIESGTRRGFLTGLVALIAAPPLVRIGSLMQIRGDVMPWPRSHRWIAAYEIMSDRVLVRADTLFGNTDSSRIGQPVRYDDRGFSAPPVPDRVLPGIWIPSERGQRILDKRGADALDVLYSSFANAIIPEHVVQRHVTLDLNDGAVLNDPTLWKQRGYR